MPDCVSSKFPRQMNDVQLGPFQGIRTSGAAARLDGVCLREPEVTFLFKLKRSCVLDCADPAFSGIALSDRAYNKATLPRRQFPIGGLYMAERKQSVLWPTIDCPERAIQVMHYGGAVAGFTALVTTCLSVASMLLGHPIFGVSSWGILDGIIFAIVAWRVYCLSPSWAMSGLILFTLEKIMIFLRSPAPGGIVTSIVFWLFYLHAARAGLYLRKAGKEVASASTGISAAPIE
jgi:hypothetical protein